MASDNSGSTRYACKCLNILISTTAPTSEQPQTSTDSAYTPVFVNDDGISVTHPQVTVRISSKGVAIPGTSRCFRYTTVTCLICNLPAYRAFQSISLDVEGNEGILFPTEEWVELDVMKSATGWIEIHTDCLVGDAIAYAESSSSYARPFYLLLQSPLSPSPSPETDGDKSSSNATSPSDTPPPLYLDLRPLFLPPPFTSSHPIFVLLSSIATKQSNELRAAAEQRIIDFITAETAGIEAKEVELRRQVEVLWKDFRVNLCAMQAEGTQRPTNLPLSPTRAQGGFAMNGSPLNTSSVTVRTFVPVPITSALSPSHSSIPKVSALSTSLATSGFHYSTDRRYRSQSPSTVNSSGSGDSNSSPTPSSRSGSATLVHPASQADGVNILQFKRNINDTINTEASYRYFLNLDEDTARFKRQQEELKKQHKEVAAKEAGPSQAYSNPSINGNKKAKTVQQTEPGSPAAESTANEAETAPSRGRDKGKRRVTFDVEPAVLTIGIEKGEGDEVAPSEDPREMIFEIEDMEGGQGLESPSSSQQNPLLIDQSASRAIRAIRARKNRPQNTQAIETFTSLRPSSLPNPSHIRPSKSPPSVDSSSQRMVTVSRAPTHSGVSSQNTTSSPRSLSDRDALILRLVAADMPSHRGAWAPDSKAWQTFTRRQDNKDTSDHSQIPEEGEFDDTEVELSGNRLSSSVAINTGETNSSDAWQPPIASSLPINIKMRTQTRQPLTLASYKPSNPPPENEPPSLYQKEPSSQSIRKSVYAERDLARSMDPGALDFAAEDDEDDEADQSETVTGDRARQHALKILQVRSEMPEEGMWRSLA